MGKLNDVSVVVFDYSWIADPHWIDIMPIEEPLRHWLEATYQEFLKGEGR